MMTAALLLFAYLETNLAVRHSHKYRQIVIDAGLNASLVLIFSCLDCAVSEQFSRILSNLSKHTLL